MVYVESSDEEMMELLNASLWDSYELTIWMGSATFDALKSAQRRRELALFERVPRFTSMNMFRCEPRIVSLSKIIRSDGGV